MGFLLFLVKPKIKTLKTNYFFYFLLLTFTFTMESKAQVVSFNDSNFKSALINNTNINTNLDGEIQLSEASNFSGSLILSALGISDLTGIEAFTSIISLDCDFNQLTSLSLSTSNMLNSINCSYNSINTLNLSGCSHLTSFNCTVNDLSNLDLPNSINLLSLFCGENHLTNLNLTNLPSLTHLYCYSNNLINLNVTSNQQLDTMNCSNNQLIGLNVSNLTGLSFLDCSTNDLLTLNLKNGNNLNYGTLIAYENPNLNCIQVDDVSWSNQNWSSLDFSSYFSNDCISGVLENMITRITFYPNPTIDKIQFSEKCDIMLYDFSNRIILNKENTYEVDLNQIPKGIYFIQFNNNPFNIFKVIKD